MSRQSQNKYTLKDVIWNEGYMLWDQMKNVMNFSQLHPSET